MMPVYNGRTESVAVVAIDAETVVSVAGLPDVSRPVADVVDNEEVRVAAA